MSSLMSVPEQSASDEALRTAIIEAYREGRRQCIRIGQLLENKRVQMGGTTRGGQPVQSAFWRWFEEQRFPFARKTAENYLAFARDPQRYELHCERVRKRSADRLRKASQYDDERDTVRVGLPTPLYHKLKRCAAAHGHDVNRELEEAVEAYLQDQVF